VREQFKSIKQDKMAEMEVMVDDSKLFAILDEISPIIPDNLPNEDLYRFIRSGFELKGEVTPRADDTYFAVFEPLDSLLKVLPAIRAGELSFSTLNSILNPEIGVRNETDHV